MSGKLGKGGGARQQEEDPSGVVREAPAEAPTEAPAVKKVRALAGAQAEAPAVKRVRALAGAQAEAPAVKKVRALAGASLESQKHMPRRLRRHVTKRSGRSEDKNL
jgi:hypothetical protein